MTQQIKQWFEANYLDGDGIQDGQMLSSRECFEAVTEATKLEYDRWAHQSQNEHDKAIIKARDAEIVGIVEKELPNALHKYGAWLLVNYEDVEPLERRRRKAEITKDLLNRITSEDKGE